MSVRFSVIIPCFNSAATIGRALSSLVNQSFNDYEIICVDDDSSDDTCDIISRYSHLTERKIHLIRNEKNSGPANARNKGLEIAKGDFICFLDSDDYYENNYFVEVDKHFRQTGADVVFYGAKQIIGNIVRPRPCPVFRSVKEAMALCGGSVWEGCWRKTLFAGLLFPSIRNAEDIALIPVLLSRADKVITIPTLLYNYVHRNNSLSGTVSPSVSRCFVRSFQYTSSMINEEVFRSELIFHGIKTILYGATLSAIKSGMKNAELSSLWEDFMKAYPDWKKNPYMPFLSKFKRVFVWAVGMRFFLFLRLFTFCHSSILKQFGN
jgi:glycosyltransferase involved in cell wall biosynthesis